MATTSLHSCDFCPRKESSDRKGCPDGWYVGFLKVKDDHDEAVMKSRFLICNACIKRAKNVEGSRVRYDFRWFVQHLFGWVKA